MPLGYSPLERTLTVSYAVPVTNSRWFIPVNSEDTTANQLAECKKLVGTGSGGTEVGSETVNPA